MAKQKQQIKLILIQGNRPGAGKDTVAQRIIYEFAHYRGHQACIHAKLSWPIKDAVHTFMHEPADDLQECSPERKEELRPLYIAVSESIKNVVDDHAFWAKRFIQDFKNKLGQFKYLKRELADIYIIVSDSGFFIETEELVHWAGKENVLMLRVHRAGAGVSDSRVMFDATRLGIEQIDINNNGTIENLKAEVLMAICKF